MNRVIHKFPLDGVGVHNVVMPARAQLLTVQAQDSVLCLWALIDTTCRFVDRRVNVVFTGNAIRSDLFLGKYVATVQMGQFVYHVFDGGEL